MIVSELGSRIWFVFTSRSRSLLSVIMFELYMLLVGVANETVLGVFVGVFIGGVGGGIGGG